MTKASLKNVLRQKPGYLKSGAPKLARLFNVSKKTAKDAIREVKQETNEKPPLHISSLHVEPEGPKGFQGKDRELFLEFLKWRENRHVVEPRKKERLPEPYKGNPENVLVIGDLHEPFCLDEYLHFCRYQQEKYDCGTVIFIGDIIDNHYSSYHESETDTFGPNEEFERAKARIARWYKVFPEAHVTIGNHDRMSHRKAKTAGIADRWLRNYSDALDTPGWKFVEQVIINDICYNHGEGGTAFTRAKNESMSQVQGHLHSQGYVNYSVGEKTKIFGMQVGCGIDRKAFAFAYGKNGKKPVISCGVVLDSGKLPILLLMDL